MKIIIFAIIGILFILFLLVFVYIYIVTESMDEYYNESNFRRNEKGYKENKSFIEEIKISNEKHIKAIQNIKTERKERKHKVSGGIKNKGILEGIKRI